MLLFLVYLSGAADYFDKVEDAAGQLGLLSTDGKSDLGLLFIDHISLEQQKHLACHSSLPTIGKFLYLYLSRYITIFNMSVAPLDLYNT